MGPKLDPAFLLDLQALMGELRRRTRVVQHLWAIQSSIGAPTRGGDQEPREIPRVREAFLSWGWQAREQGRIDTPEGELELGADSWPVIQSLAVKGWERDLWRKEPRAKATAAQEEALGRLPGEERVEPVLRQHRKRITQGYWERRTAIAALAEGKASKLMQASKRARMQACRQASKRIQATRSKQKQSGSRKQAKSSK